MRSRSAAPIVVVAVLVAFVPVVPWALAALFGAPDSRWLDSLGGLGVSIPVGLGVAAVGLAVHGLLLQRDFEEDVAHEYDQFLVAPPMTTVGAANGGTNGSTAVLQGVAPTAAAAPTGAAPAVPGTAMADVPPDAPPESGTMTVSDRAGDLLGSPRARQMGQRVGNRAMSRGRSTVRRALRDVFRGR